MRHDVDVAVVGGGILGCLVADTLDRRDPGTTVVLLDRAGLGDGASRRSAGLHFRRGRTPTVRAWSAESERHYADLLAARPALPVHPTPTVVAARSTSPAELQEIYDGRLRPRADPGSPLGPLPADARSWWLPGGQHADVGRLTRVLATDLRSRVDVREGVAVDRVGLHDDGVVLGLRCGSSLRAARVVAAPGPWATTAPWTPFTAPIGVRTKKIVALHLEAPAAPTDPAVVLHDEDAFLLPLPERGHWLVSYTSPEYGVDPDALDGSLSPADLHRGRAVLENWFPGAGARLRSGRVFCDAYSAHGEPEVRLLAPRLVFAGAANGSGYRLAPAMAARAADLLAPVPA